MTWITRRQAAQWLLAASGSASPLIAQQHPARKHLASPGTMDAADARARAGAKKPEFFTPHQDETFTLLAERIIPGSTKAQANRFVDLLLGADTKRIQQRFANALAAFDAASLIRYNRPFKALSEAEQNEVLTAASILPRTRRRREFGPNQPERDEDNTPLTMRDHFENIKGWVRAAYYSSEVGMRELGWNGEVDYPAFPGCDHPTH